jgi:hypothetical protein
MASAALSGRGAAAVGPINFQCQLQLGDGQRLMKPGRGPGASNR